MAQRTVTAVLILITFMILASPAQSQQNVAPIPPRRGSAHADLEASATPQAATPAKPFTQDQVQAMVRDGLADETGAKAIEQRGIDFAPTEDFIQSLKTAGASEAFLAALRSAKHPQPAGETVKKPLNQVQVFALLAGQVPSHRIAVLVQERGIDFQPDDEYLREVRLAGGEDDLVNALKNAKVTKPEHVDAELQARETQVRGHVAQGREFFQKGRYDDAEDEYRKALRLDPANPDLHMALGAALGMKRDPDGAINEMREVLRLSPDSDNAHVNLGMALGVKGDLDGAIREYREALHLNPDNDRAHVRLGAVLGYKNDWDGAIVEFRAALRVDPLDKETHVMLGSALSHNRDWGEAIAEYREALQLDPKDDEAHLDLAFALGQTGNRDDEIGEYREALRLNPNNYYAHTQLGLALGQKGDWDGEIAEEREAVRINPNHALAHYALGLAFEAEAHAREALEEYRAAYELEPKDPQYRQSYERLLQQMSR